MSVASRLVLLALAAVACLTLYERDLVTRDPDEMTAVALRQFANSDAAAEELRVAGAARHWQVLGGAAGLALLAALLFGDDARRWCRRQVPQPHPGERG